MPIQCPNPKCQELISDTDRFCPHCGIRVAVEIFNDNIRPSSSHSIPVKVRRPQENTNINSYTPPLSQNKTPSFSQNRTPWRMGTSIIMLGILLLLPFGGLFVGWYIYDHFRFELLEFVVGLTIPGIGLLPSGFVSKLNQSYPPTWFKFVAFISTGFWCYSLSDTNVFIVSTIVSAFLYFVCVFSFRPDSNKPGISRYQPQKLPRHDYMGIVTNLRQWKTPHHWQSYSILDWQFDLRCTDKNWQPLQDRQGFILPLVSVEFLSNKVHGPSLEEGCRVVLQGGKTHGRVRAKAIWNLSPSMASSSYGEPSVFWGRVISWQYPTQVQDPRYPGQGKYLQQWSFRLQRSDENGNFLPPLPVVIRAQNINGNPPRDGDEVEISGQVVNGTLYAQGVVNLSLKASLIIKGWAGIPTV